MARSRKPRPTRIPSRLVLRETGDGVEVSWRWYSPFYFVALALYAAGLAVAYVAVEAVREGNVVADWQRPVVGLAVAWMLASTWVVAALFLNRTTVRVAGGVLAVTHWPFYWPGGRRFHAADVTDVSVAEFVDSTGEGDPVVTYRLYVYTRSSYPRTLVAGIENKKEADRLAGLVNGALRRAAGDAE
ncbi:MAG: hypothetical protein U0804_12500 [Gemmataceae bacterium]